MIGCILYTLMFYRPPSSREPARAILAASQPWGQASAKPGAGSELSPHVFIDEREHVC